MKRVIEEKLLKWKESQRRQPLIIRGARQIGKTYSVLKLGSTFQNGIVNLDFEKYPEANAIFEKNLEPKRIIREIELLLGKSIYFGSTLLFLDEIQNCPKAVMSLRYFYEEMPELHVIAAGSLLEFALSEISFPVGRVQFLEMHALGFYEFLLAINKDILAQEILDTPKKLSDLAHNQLSRLLKEYFFVGGMPLAVKVYAETNSIQECMELERDLVVSYRQDFSKYTPKVDKDCLNEVLESCAKLVSQQIKYSVLANDFTNPTIKKAFNLLCMAKVIRKVVSANPQGFPLSIQRKEKTFKAIMVDIGIMNILCRLSVDVEYSKKMLLDVYRGAVAEQFIGQELLVSGRDSLYYWSRDARGSNAEVDYIIVKNNDIIPIEIKSGSSGRLKSMHMFLKQYENCPYGIVFSDAPYAELPEQKLKFIPLYYAYSFFVS